MENDHSILSKIRVKKKKDENKHLWYNLIQDNMVTGGKNLLPVGLLLGQTGVKGSVPQVCLGL